MGMLAACSAESDLHQLLILHRYEEGMLTIEQSLKLRAEAQDKLGISDGLHEMGLMCYQQGDALRARGFFEQVKS